jgi:hypothetical protein
VIEVMELSELRGLLKELKRVRLRNRKVKRKKSEL